MSEIDSGGKGSGGKKDKGSSFWDGLRNVGQGILEGLTGGGQKGSGAGVQRKVDRGDPVLGERRAAATQIHRSLKAWRERGADEADRKNAISEDGVAADEAHENDLGSEKAEEPKSESVEGKSEQVARKVMLSPKGGKKKGTGGGAPLPTLDRTGKVHGELPRPADLGKYDVDELQVLLDQLRQSVPKRIEVTTAKGRDRQHGQRQGAEQDLITAIEKHLESRK